MAEPDAMAPLRKPLHEGVEQLRKRLGGDLSQTLGKTKETFPNLLQGSGTIRTRSLFLVLEMKVGQPVTTLRF